MRQAESGERPRTPYVEVARALDADVVDAAYLAEHGSAVGRQAGKRIGLVEGQVWTTFANRGRYRHIVAWVDRVGLELALLLKLARARRDLVIVSNWLAGPSKRIFLERLRVQSHVGSVIGYGSVQLELVAERYGFPGTGSTSPSSRSTTASGCPTTGRPRTSSARSAASPATATTERWSRRPEGCPSGSNWRSAA